LCNGRFAFLLQRNRVFLITGSAFHMFQVLRRLGLAVVSIVFSIEVIEMRLSVSHVDGISFVVGSLFFCCLCHSSGNSSSSSSSSSEAVSIVVIVVVVVVAVVAVVVVVVLVLVVVHMDR
jgi:hypothetical protein